jgi:hypothetical protein
MNFFLLKKLQFFLQYKSILIVNDFDLRLIANKLAQVKGKQNWEKIVSHRSIKIS